MGEEYAREVAQISAALGEWGALPFFDARFGEVLDTLASETRSLLPPAEDVFAALVHTPPGKVKCVILGQDPYPTRGHAHGLAFSVTPETPLPRSLKNIYAELEDDLGMTRQNGDLRPWAKEGVLLLNTALTVPEGEAGAHSGLGWSTLTAQILARVSQNPSAFILWGRHAQSYEAHIQNPAAHLILKSAHPSPLSARRGFFGSKPFSGVNEWLESAGKTPVDWR